MRLARSIADLIESFETLPGVGPKTASRLAFYLLHVPQTDLDRFAEALTNLKRNTVICETCFNIAEGSPCDVCADTSRDSAKILVVEQPFDVLALERADGYEGVYHVLNGAISPLNNIGPADLTIGELLGRVRSGTVSEVILAMDHDLEGEATAMYIHREIGRLVTELGLEVEITRLAKGIPMGGNVEYADEVTLKRALEGRVTV